MKATFAWLGVLCAAALLPSTGRAQSCYPQIPQAPDMCNPGYYCSNQCGTIYGPNHCVYPPFPPFQGMVFGPQNGQCGGGVVYPGFPTHPFARGPRDYFMYYDP